MKKYFSNERGVTLIELLAVIVIGSIILILVSNIHIFSQKQYNNQTEKSELLYDVTYAAKIITKEIRRAEKVSIADNVLTLNKGEPNQVVFKKDDNLLLMDGNKLVSSISEFEVTFKNNTESGKIIKLFIESKGQVENENQLEEIETEIYVRGGN